jgi:DNA-directed RNA polymerase specialized sigma24 family protein
VAAAQRVAGSREDILRVYALVYSGVGNRLDAEELTTEVFSRLRRGRGVTRGAAGDPLAGTTRAVLADHWRRHFGAEGEVNRPGVEVVLAGLPTDYRTVLELRFWHGCSIEDLAGRMNLSVGDAAQLQRAALRSAARMDRTPPAAWVAAGGTQLSGP